MQRCNWVTSDPVYVAYHDNEWGVPQTNSRALFEMLCLEGQQAGLSWITVLKKRENYRAAFRQFDAQAIALMDEADITRLMQDSTIIRHRGKITAIITNSHAYLAMSARGEDFARFVWRFVDNQPQINHFIHQHDIPSRTAISDKLSAELKKRGFSFAGSTTCYAFMQACGLVNDHITGCYCHPDATTGRA